MGKKAGPDCSKQNGRRNQKHMMYYSSLPPKVAKRKDRNVFKSSHGKFKNVAELVAHQLSSGKQSRPRISSAA